MDLDDIVDFIKIVIGLIIAGCLFVFFIAVVGSVYNINYYDNVPVKCYVDGRLVYDGKSCGISVKSTGDTTRVDISGGFLYWFPKAYYVSKDVELMGDKRKKK